ncbi:uncharacterized protein Tco025E_05001 [Trypanosoma conorhini]|uniref:Anaphase-promoting complex subunit 5 n=1 Tax=Trypanosoma conorhini TaxID=83891 RepID=A0A422PGN5_9TRYP|nr:uncharacterized protein Tco025E_05001 [Trypanosoma conorhini]RNF16876.1 hypothetical protein Tco025E_05001 [Trypanosoma conorhini]
MSLRGPSLSVPNAEGVPRLTDVALDLCGRALASVWPLIVASGPEKAETFACWYLRRVAFMQERTKEDFDEARNVEVPADAREGGEANFSLAFNALCRGPVEKETHGWQRERSSSVPTVFGFAEQSSSSAPLLAAAPVTPVEGSAGGDGERHRAFAYFEELLDLCRDVGGRDIREDCLQRVISLITGDFSCSGRAPRALWGSQSLEERAAVILPALSALFTLRGEFSAEHVPRSLTTSFLVWMRVSWSCASFAWKTHIARAVGEWLADFESRRASTALSGATLPLSQPMRPPQKPKSSSHRPSARSFPPVLEGKQRLNIANMCIAMRRICEGCSPSERDLLELLIQSGCGVQFSDQNVLEHVMSDAAAGGGASDAHLSHHSILLRIASGMLLYALFYLTVNSLEAALHCARTAVLVGHQWRSDEFLTMAHYSSFLVRLASQDAPAAAGEIAILLQLADAAAHRDDDVGGEANYNAPRYHAGCLGYMGAALLLLICPGTLDTYLRSVIIAGIVAGRPAASEATADGQAVLGGTRKSHGSHAEAEAARGGHSVVVQTIAQTVRFALWLSEMETLLDPSSTVVTEIITGVGRETLMIIAGHYGVRVAQKAINAASLGRLLRQLDEEVSTASSLFSCQPASLLLRETLRQTAHRALATQVGAAEPSPGAGPLNILHDFLVAVEVHYGEDGAEVVRGDFFFTSTYRFLFAVWLRKHGYMKSAYQELTRLADSMLFHSRCSTDDSMVGGETASAAAAAAAVPPLTKKMTHTTSVLKKSGLEYWPPDHLLLWQQVQFERAQLARYLGYSATLPAIDGALRRVSAGSHLVMGVLYADLVAAMMCFQRGNYAEALHVLDKVLSGAKRIGLTLVQAHANSMRVSALLTCSRWDDAQETLSAMRPLPSLLEPGFLLARLRAQGESLLASSAATEADLVAVVEHHVRRMEACGCFREEPEEEDSVGITLAEKLCVHACIARFAVTSSSSEQQQSWENNLAALSRTLRQRQFQEGKWQVLCNMPMRHVCRDILSGALLQQLTQTP